MGWNSKSQRVKGTEWWTGEGERATEPGDIHVPLMLPFHDTRFWYQALISLMQQCWQIHSVVDRRNIMLFNTQKRTDFQHVFRASNLQISLRDLLRIPWLKQGCALAEPGGPWRLTFALGQLENLRFFTQDSVPGTLDFTVSKHWAPFNFP